MNVSEFYKRFPTEQACHDFIVRERWNGQPKCTHCGHDKCYQVKDAMGFKCAGCRKRFSVRHGTIMERSKLPLQTWLLAIHIMTTGTPARSKTTAEKISSTQFAQKLGVVPKTAWFIATRIREACTKECAEHNKSVRQKTGQHLETMGVAV